MYRRALQLRRELSLGRGTLSWVRSRDDVLAFRNGGLLMLTNFGNEPVILPANAEVVIASGALTDDGRVPIDVTVWARG
jgi:alpha-glucosidase